jgi:hypothetical protein
MSSRASRPYWKVVMKLQAALKDSWFPVRQFLGSIGTTDQVGIISGLQYIEKMVAEVGSTPDFWATEDFLRENHAHEFDIILEPREINARLFRLLKDRKAARTQDAVVIDIAIVAAIEARRHEFVRRQERDAKNKIDENLRHIQAYQTTVEDYLKASLIEHSKLLAIKNRNPEPFDKQIIRALEGGFYTFLGFVNDWLEFRTTSDIILEYSYPSAKTHFRVNLGVFKVAYDVTTSRTRVLPFERNVKAGGYYHPHIDAGGMVCWGNAKETAMAALAAGDFQKALLVLQSVLTMYNADSPYNPIESFQAVSGQLQPGKLVPMEAPDEDWDVCAYCGESVDDHNVCEVCEACQEGCECNDCVRCEERPWECRCEEGYSDDEADRPRDAVSVPNAIGSIRCCRH